MSSVRIVCVHCKAEVLEERDYWCTETLTREAIKSLEAIHGGKRCPHEKPIGVVREVHADGSATIDCTAEQVARLFAARPELYEHFRISGGKT